MRDLVAFVLRTGDLGSPGHFAGANRALEGTRTHQRLQKSRPMGYQAELVVKHSTDTEDFILELNGRIDGVLVQDGSLLVEEIKTVTRIAGITADRLHWGQAKVYAFLYAQAHGFGTAEVRITYVELDSFLVTEFSEHFTLGELKEFFDAVLAEYVVWLREYHRWLKARDASIAELKFPFPYRPGQRQMAVAVYKNIRERGRFFAEAPTGIGKTLSVLFPSIKALAEREVEKIFYLTAKTIGRSVAEETLAALRSTGLKLRAVSVTARDKICFNDGEPCDVRTCPYAIGYYDRIKDALRESLEAETLTRVEIEALARKHSVCPFELSLDLTQWADCVICDYNYAIDPSVSLKRYFAGERQNFAMLVDEAHNLVDRAREMFSAEITMGEIAELRRMIGSELKSCARVLGRLKTRVAELREAEGWNDRAGNRVRKEAPDKVVKMLRDFCKAAEEWLVLNEPAVFRQALLNFYFRALGFARVAELFDERYVTMFEIDAERLRLFCIDPSKQLRETLAGMGSTVFFSATLRPAEYYRESLGGGMTDPCLALNSPFPPEALQVLLHYRTPTRLRERERGYEEIASSIAAMASARRGNYLVYFPSYDYLQQVLDRFGKRYPEFRTRSQAPGMSENDREAFLKLFQAGAEALIGFAVLGGVFGEGIDLVGERLIGVAVVGVGLPQLCLERDLIRDYWQGRERFGFDFAYTFPGMNRVLQAAGRTIRSENDRGIVLLLDDRFGRHPYAGMFPAWWHPKGVRAAAEVFKAAAEFWGNKCNTENDSRG